MSYLESGITVDISNGAGETPLVVACRHGLVTMARFLLHHGATSTVVLKETMNTPLHIAAYCPKDRCFELVSFLFQHGADPNALSLKGFTPLHVASLAGNTRCCVALLAHKADPLIRSYSGLLPRDTASTDEIRTLLRHDRLLSPKNKPIMLRRASISTPPTGPDHLLEDAPSPHRLRAPRERSISSPFLKPRGPPK